MFWLFVLSVSFIYLFTNSVKAQCTLDVNHYELICNDNGTAANPADDYVIIKINAAGTNASANYRVLVQTIGGGTTLFTSANTAYGTEVTITGDGLGGNPTLPADGTSTWQLTVRDQSTGTCRQIFETIPVNPCSPPCPDKNCGDVTVDGTLRTGTALNSNGFELEDGYIRSGEGVTTPPNPSGANGGIAWDVAYYNSSRFGANRGGASYSAGYHTGAWTQVVPPDKNGYIAKHTYRSVTAYNRFGLAEGHMLGINTMSEDVVTGMTYNYNFGNYDFGNNIAPNTLTDGDVIWDTWFCPSSNTNSSVNATNDNTFHTMKFKDGNGNVMLELGTGNVWFTGASGFPESAVSVWTKADQDATLLNRSANGNGIFANVDGWSEWKVIFHMNSTGPDSVSVILIPAAQDAGLGVLQTYNAPIVLLDRVPLIGNLDANYLADWEITTEGGGNKYFYEEGYSFTCPQSSSVVICDNGSTSTVLTAPATHTNVVWYNSEDTQVGTGSSLTVTSNTAGMGDGSDFFYYNAIDAAGCAINLCCVVSVETKTCVTCTISNAVRAFNPTCTTAGRLQLFSTNGDKYGISKGNTYTGPAYASATAVPGTLPANIKTNISHAADSTWTIRVFNKANDCFKDTTVTVKALVKDATVTVANGFPACRSNGTAYTIKFTKSPAASVVTAKNVATGGEYPCY
ncbi:MAG: hypothetical protein R2822_07580 [Spirosomataceae bacterium]